MRFLILIALFLIATQSGTRAEPWNLQSYTGHSGNSLWLGLIWQDDEQEQTSDDDAKKLPPEVKATATANRKISRVFAKELNARDPQQQAQTLETLIKTGQEETDDVMQFALLTRAHKQAIEYGNAGAAVAAASEIDKRFQVNVWELHVDALKKLTREARVAAKLQEVLSTYESVVMKAAEKNHFDAAIDITEAMSLAARKLRNAELSDSIKNTKEYLQFSKKIFDRWQSSKESGNRDEMQFDQGLFMFFVQSDTKGLELIATKDSTTIGKLAADELAQPTEQKLVDIANGWLDWSKKLSSREKFEKNVAKQHAADLLNKALPKLKGLAKKEVEILISEIQVFDAGMKKSGTTESSAGGRWSMDWQSQQDWEIIEFVGKQIAITMDGKREVYDFTRKGNVVEVKLDNPNRVYTLNFEGGQLTGKIVDTRDGRLINKGEGAPLK